MKNLIANNKILLLAIIVVFSRIPFIFNSLGCDYDNWREIFSGKLIHEEHIYNVSRFPGYPFSEFLFSLIYQLPYWCINFTSVIFTAGSAIFFYLLLLEKNVKNPFAISVGFSFIPIIFINSTVSIDYNISLFFILASTYLIVKNKIFWGSLFFGLVVCSRFNNVIFMIPFLYLVYFQSINRILTLKFLLQSTFFATLFFLPVIIRYNGKFLYHYGTEVASLKTYLSLSTLYIFGFLGTITLLVLSIWNILSERKNLNQKIRKFTNDSFFKFSVLFISINFLFFLKFPLESGYLIPSVPFLVFIFSKIFSEKSIKIITFSFMLSPFFFYINAKNFEFKGVAFVNENMENQQLKMTHSLISKINTLPKNSIVCVANIYEQLILVKGKNGFSNNKIFTLLPKESLEKLKKENINIYFTDEANTRSKEEFGFELKDYGKSIFKIYELDR